MTFYKWYSDRIKKNVFVMIITIIIATFAAIGSIYGGVQAFNAISNTIQEKYFENQILYERLAKINTGLNIEFVEDIIGKPAIIKKLPSQLVNYTKSSDGTWKDVSYPSGLDEYTERIYIHKKYFLQIITNAENIISSYAITTRDPSFNPRVPLEIYHATSQESMYPYITDLNIGKMKITDLKDTPENINIGNWGMNYFYIETYYFGNPGFYKHYLFELSPSGCCLSDNVAYEQLISIESTERKEGINNYKDNKKILEMRSTIKPNTFGVINGFENKKLFEFFTKEGLGPNCYEIREFK
jgi:hypothetical protein